MRGYGRGESPIVLVGADDAAAILHAEESTFEVSLEEEERPLARCVGDEGTAETTVQIANRPIALDKTLED